MSDLEAATIMGTPGEGFWWRLRDRWALVSQAMTAGGEPVLPDRELAERSYTEARGAHVLRSQDVNDTQAVCDVCGTQPIAAAYPARRFIGPTGGMMGGPTSLCQACHTLYQRGDVNRIFRRVERRLPSMRDARVREAIFSMLRTLFDNFTGPAVLIGS